MIAAITVCVILFMDEVPSEEGVIIFPLAFHRDCVQSHGTRSALCDLNTTGLVYLVL